MKKIDNQTYFENTQKKQWANKPIVFLENPINGENIGFINRLCGVLNIDKIYLVHNGYTSEIKDSKIKRTATSSFNLVKREWIHINDVKKHLPEDYQLVAVDTTNVSKNIFETTLTDKVAFVLGNENIGITDEMLALCDLSIHIPLIGKTHSLNISHAFSIIGFEYLKQQMY